MMHLLSWVGIPLAMLATTTAAAGAEGTERRGDHGPRPGRI